MSIRLTAALWILLLATAASPAQTPLGTAFTYQGRLKQANQPYNGSADLVFNLYDDPNAGNLLGTQTLNGVAVSGGLFTVQLNGAGEFGASAFNGEQRWLEVVVNGTPLSPRQELTAGPYALFSKDSGQLAGQLPGFYLDAGNLNAGTLAPARGGMGIDTSAAASGSLLSTSGVGVWSLLAPGTDSQVLTLAGGVPTWGNPSGFALPYSGSANIAAPDAAFKITNTDTGYGLWGQSDGSAGLAVRGTATSPTGFVYGGYFESASTDGRGVFGQASAATGLTYGGRFGSLSTSGIGVSGVASAASGATYGGYFQADSGGSPRGGVGVYGVATSTFNTTYGVWGDSASTAGTGAFGRASASTGTTYGVFGQSDSTSGYGVWGTGGFVGMYGTGASYGVRGSSTANGFGVYGSGAQYGVYASGNLGASGTKSFRIDHPNDPENKYLLHYSAEGPEVLNIYRGTVVLDGAGEAVVQLPEYFAMINKTPSYQLTAVGAPMPMLHVAEEISERDLAKGPSAEPDQGAPICWFRIAGGAPDKKVSWEVKAVRNDRWVQRHGAPVEYEKEGIEKGTYQHPELYGQPAEKGMNYHAEHERPSSTAPLEGTPR